MIVFKNYFKVAKSYTKIILIYSILFIGIAIFATTPSSTHSNFETSKVNVALINQDEYTPLIQGLTDFIEEKANIINIESDEDSLRDALFFRKVDFIMIIPKGYSRDFLDNQNPLIETKSVPDSYEATYANMIFNNYLNTAQIYSTLGMSEEKIVKNVKVDLLKQGDVYLAGDSIDNNSKGVQFFYNFSSYVLLALIVDVLAMVMLSMRQESIEKRNKVSPVSYQQFNRQLLYGNCCLTLIITNIFIVASFILYPQFMFSFNGLLIIINTLLYALLSLTLSLFLTTLIKHKHILGGVSTVIALGSAFISGAFVPQELLSPFILSIAKITPAYWYVSSNNLITSLVKVTTTTLQPVLYNSIVLIAFTIVLYIGIQWVGKYKMKGK